MVPKQYLLGIALGLCSVGAYAQNNFPTTGDASISDASLTIETSTWRSNLLTLKDTHYSPDQIYHLQIESDGLKIKQDGNINYLFKTGGDFILKNGELMLGDGSPLYKLHIKDPAGGAAIGLERGGKVWRFDLEANANRLFIGHTDNASMFTFHKNGQIGIGTTSPDAKLTVKGKIHAEEVKVDLSVPGPDYVFKEGYDLRTLEETQQYIKEHGHLPNIPSAKEMERNGVELGVMNMRLLEKIEELTLHMIALKKEIDELKNNKK